jgi:hypothetical protein
MGYEIDALKRLRVYVEPNGSYAIDNQANLGTATTFQDIKVTDATAELKLEQLDNETMMQRIDGKLPMVNARRRSALTFTSYLNGTGTAAGKSVVPLTSSLQNVLSTIMGGINYMSGTGIQSVAGAAGGFYKVDAASQFKAGSAFGLLNSTTNRLECVRVASTNTSNNTITASLGQTFLPVSGATMYGGSTIYLTQDPNKSLQAYVEGVNDYDKWNLLGLQGGFGLKTEIGTLPTIDFKLEGASWISASAANGAVTLAEATYSDATPPPFVDGLIYVNLAPNDTTTTRVALAPVDCPAFEFTPSIAYTDVLSERGVNNIVRKRRNRTAPIGSGKFTIYETGVGTESIVYQQIRENIYNSSAQLISGSQWLEIGFQVGTTAGNVVFISMPQCQITDVKRVGTNDLATVEVSFNCHESRVTTPTATNVTDLARSAFTINLL